MLQIIKEVLIAGKMLGFLMYDFIYLGEKTYLALCDKVIAS